MRRLLNCNVCHERRKNRIITKCCHVFCDVCIDRTLTARNRKCPGCGIVFAKVRRPLGCTRNLACSSARRVSEGLAR